MNQDDAPRPYRDSYEDAEERGKKLMKRIDDLVTGCEQRQGAELVALHQFIASLEIAAEAMQKCVRTEIEKVGRCLRQEIRKTVRSKGWPTK